MDKLGLQKLKMNFEYLDKLVTINAEPYKSIYEIKLKAIKKLFPCPDDLRCYYQNKDISNKLNEKIGNFFQGKDTVNIKLIKPDNKKDNEKYKIKKLTLGFDSSRTSESKEVKNLHDNLLPKSPNDTENGDAIKNFSTNKNQLIAGLLPIKKGMNNIKYFNTENNNSVELIRSNSNNNNPINENLNVNSINSQNKNEETNNNTAQNQTEALNKEEEKPKPRTEIKCACRKGYVSCYCRNCKIFLCQACRINDVHKDHLTVHVDTSNLEDSVKLYAIIVQTDIDTNTQCFDKFYKLFVNTDFTERLHKQKTIIDKLSDLSEKYKHLVQSIQSKICNDKSIPKLFSNYNQDSQNISIEIEKLLSEMYNNYSFNNKAINFRQFSTFFKLINSKEKEWDEINRSFKVFKLCDELNEKISKLFDKINVTIDELFAENSAYNSIQFLLGGGIMIKGRIANTKNNLLPKTNILKNKIEFKGKGTGRLLNSNNNNINLNSNFTNYTKEFNNNIINPNIENNKISLDATGTNQESRKKQAEELKEKTRNKIMLKKEYENMEKNKLTESNFFDKESCKNSNNKNNLDNLNNFGSCSKNEKIGSKFAQIGVHNSLEEKYLGSSTNDDIIIKRSLSQKKKRK